MGDWLKFPYQFYKTFNELSRPFLIIRARLGNNQQQSLQIRGTMYRYDAVTEKLHQYNFQTSYERIGNELVAFKSKYVDPVTKTKSALNLKSVLAIAGLLLVSILVFGSNKAGSGGVKKELYGSTGE